MVAYASQYPGYGFETHVGYGTASHLAGLKSLGPCPIHRKTFKPLRGFVRSVDDGKGGKA